MFQDILYKAYQFHLTQILSKTFYLYKTIGIKHVAVQFQAAWVNMFYINMNEITIWKVLLVVTKPQGITNNFAALSSFLAF